MDQDLLLAVKTHLELTHSIEERRRTRDEQRLASLPASSSAIDRDYHQELVWPREDLKATKAALIDAVSSGVTDTFLAQGYAAASCAVSRSTVKHAFLSLLNDNVLALGSSLREVLPGLQFPTLEPSL